MTKKEAIGILHEMLYKTSYSGELGGLAVEMAVEALNKQEESVSEDLENAAETYTNSRENKKFEVGEGYGMNDVEDAFKAGAKWQKESIWHKESDHPNNRHPYPVLNPDGEMAFAYYDQLCGWQFDRDFPCSVNMLWLDIEKILPKKEEKV